MPDNQKPFTKERIIEMSIQQNIDLISCLTNTITTCISSHCSDIVNVILSLQQRNIQLCQAKETLDIEERIEECIKKRIKEALKRGVVYNVPQHLDEEENDSNEEQDNKECSMAPKEQPQPEKVEVKPSEREAQVGLEEAKNTILIALSEICFDRIDETRGILEGLCDSASVFPKENRVQECIVQLNKLYEDKRLDRGVMESLVNMVAEHC